MTPACFLCYCYRMGGRRRAVRFPRGPDAGTHADRQPDERTRRDDPDLPLWKDALYEHVARRLLNHQPLVTIASAVGYSIDEIRNIVRGDAFRTVYQRVKQDVYGSIDDAMYDQRRDIVERVTAGAPRALTELFWLIENGRSERVRKEAAELVLGIGGHTPVQRRIEALAVAHLDEAQLDKLSAAFGVARRRDAITVTVDPP